MSDSGVSGIFGGSAPGVSRNPYGRDWACTDDVDPGGVEVEGIRCLAEALYRRLITPRGGLLGDPNYGFDLRAFMNDDYVQGNLTDLDQRGLLARIAQGVDAELVKDERVARSQTLATSAPGGILNVVIAVTPLSGPSFRLVVAVTEVSVDLLRVAT